MYFFILNIYVYVFRFDPKLHTVHLKYRFNLLNLLHWCCLTRFFLCNGLRSPLSGLHIRYDSSGPLVPGLGSGTDSLPPAATSIDQLLERQWNEGQQFLLQQGSQEDGESNSFLRTHLQ